MRRTFLVPLMLPCEIHHRLPRGTDEHLAALPVHSGVCEIRMHGRGCQKLFETFPAFSRGFFREFAVQAAYHPCGNGQPAHCQPSEEVPGFADGCIAFRVQQEQERLYRAVVIHIVIHPFRELCVLPFPGRAVPGRIRHFRIRRYLHTFCRGEPDAGMVCMAELAAALFACFLTAVLDLPVCGFL